MKAGRNQKKSLRALSWLCISLSLSGVAGCAFSPQISLSSSSAPTLSISGPTPSIGSSSTTFAFTVTYSGASNITLAAADVTLAGTATAGCTTSVSGSGTTTRTVSVTGCSGDGTLNIAIAAGTASDAAGNLAAASSRSSDGTVVNSTASQSPQIVPAVGLTLNADPGVTRTLGVSGGTAPFVYEITSGEGSIHSSTGVFTPASRRGSTTVRVTDAQSRTSQVTLEQITSRFNGRVSAMTMDSHGYGYFGGSFTTYNPIYAPGFAALDTASGDLKAGTCDFAGSFGLGSVISAVAENSDSLYLGGTFTSYAGVTVQNLIKVSKSTCALDTTFSQTTGTNSSVSALAVSGSSLYVGGSFTTYRGVAAPYLAKVDLSSGNLDTSFTQATGMDSSVIALAVSGSSLYLGGQFTTYRGVAAQRLAKIDLTSGNLDTTFTQSTGFGGRVHALDVSGSSLYVGGDFTTYRGAAANKLAKVDLASGNLDTTFTQATGLGGRSVYALAVSGSALYVGGEFTTYRGAAAQRLAKVDLATGNLDTTFTQSTGTDSFVSALAVSGSSLYVGGWFTYYRGLLARRLAKVDLATGNLDTSFTQSTGVSGGYSVYALAISGSSLYVGGDFTSYRGVAAERLAKVNLTSGNLDTSFTQSTGMNSSVSALAVSGSSLYVGGDFSSYRGAAAPYMTIVDLLSGALAD